MAKNLRSYVLFLVSTFGCVSIFHARASISKVYHSSDGTAVVLISQNWCFPTAMQLLSTFFYCLPVTIDRNINEECLFVFFILIFSESLLVTFLALFVYWKTWALRVGRTWLVPNPLSLLSFYFYLPSTIDSVQETDDHSLYSMMLICLDYLAILKWKLIML